MDLVSKMRSQELTAVVARPGNGNTEYESLPLSSTSHIKSATVSHPSYKLV